MTKLEDVVRQNRKAAEELMDMLGSMKDTIDALRALREAGFVRSEPFRPMPGGRQSLEDIKPRRPSGIAFKVAFGA
jgi:hypothetical protein